MRKESRKSMKAHKSKLIFCHIVQHRIVHTYNLSRTPDLIFRNSRYPSPVEMQSLPRCAADALAFIAGTLSPQPRGFQGQTERLLSAHKVYINVVELKQHKTNSKGQGHSCWPFLA